jgi:hypothetical protein
LFVETVSRHLDCFASAQLSTSASAQLNEQYIMTGPNCHCDEHGEEAIFDMLKFII